MERRFLSPREVAEYVGVHLQTVYGWIGRGEIHASRLGRKVLIDRKVLDAQLCAGQAAAIRDGRPTT